MAIERGLKGEIAEDFISGLKQLFEDHYVDVPDEKYDVLEAQSEKISELSQIIELNLSNNKKTKDTAKKIQANKANKLYSDGKNEFLLGNYGQAITLFTSFAKSSPDSPNIKDSKLWLARAYSASEVYLKAKDAFLDYQANNQEHSKYADSMFELSRVLVKLNEINDARLLLSEMIRQYPSHSLINKATQLLSDL